MLHSSGADLTWIKNNPFEIGRPQCFYPLQPRTINKSLCKNCPLHLVQKQENFHSTDSCREGIATGPIHTICRILSWFQAFDRKMFVSPLIFEHLRTLQPTNSIPFKAWDLWLSHEYLRQPWPPKATKVVKSFQGAKRAYPVQLRARRHQYVFHSILDNQHSWTKKLKWFQA